MQGKTAYQQCNRWHAAAGKAAAAAANAAYEANLDLVVSLGWAYMEALSHQIFQNEVARAPEQLQGHLRSLALLYGLTRIERNAAFYLAHGALRQPHFQVGILPALTCNAAIQVAHGVLRQYNFQTVWLYPHTAI